MATAAGGLFSDERADSMRSFDRGCTAGIVFVFLVLAVAAHAQEVDQGIYSDPPIGMEDDQGIYTIPTPIEQQEILIDDTGYRASRSFANTVAWNPRNRFGFSLGVSGGTISNVNPGFMDRQRSDLTSMTGSVFANFGRQRSRLHVDYGAGYRVYYQRRDLDGIDHNANMTYTYDTGRKSRLTLSNIISSSLNDPYSSFGPDISPSMDWTVSPSFSVLFLPQRVTQNRAGGRFDYSVTEKTHINFFGYYKNHWYDRQRFRDVNAIEVGAGLNRVITSWMHLSSSYSTYLYSSNNRLRDNQIHRLEIGRFNFMLSPNVEVFTSGGIEITERQNGFRTHPMLRAGITRASETNIIHANYQRTMTSALGYDRVLWSDSITFGFGQRITDRSNIRLSASYMRGSDFVVSGRLQGLYGQAQFEYALLSNLFASVNYTHQYQENTIRVLTDVPHYDRSMVFGSLRFSWPAIRLGRE
jgi:hypothetical protein